MADFSLKPIILFFVAVIIGIVFLGVIADNQVANTELSGVTNESISIGATGNGTTVNADVIGVSYFGNISDSTDLGSFVFGKSVNFTKTGLITVNTTDHTYNISYSYEGELYVVDKKSHTFLKLLGLFFVFTIVAFGIKAMMDSSGNLTFGFK